MLCKQIRRDELNVGSWYVGRGRNANVGFWNGEEFLVISEKWGRTVVKAEPYYDDEFGCFQPFREIDQGKVAEPVNASSGDAWDRHYAKSVEFNIG